jgi:toxin ParE1/3/4
MSKYHLARLARSDVDEIWLYLAREGGQATADRVVEPIAAAFPLLARMPELGRTRPEIDRGLRSFPVGTYIIYYKRRQRGGIVISRVLHAMRDQQNAWSEED